MLDGQRREAVRETVLPGSLEGSRQSVLDLPPVHRGSGDSRAGGRLQGVAKSLERQFDRVTGRRRSERRSPRWSSRVERGLYAEGILKRFWRLIIVEPTLIPVGMVSVFKSSKIQWDSSAGEKKNVLSELRGICIVLAMKSMVALLSVMVSTIGRLSEDCKIVTRVDAWSPGDCRCIVVWIFLPSERET